MGMFENGDLILDELEKISNKVAFMAAVSEAMTRPNDGIGISEAAVNGMYLFYSDIENSCQIVAETLRNDFFIIKQDTTEKKTSGNEGTVADRTKDFCAAVEKEISRHCKKERGG